MAGRLSEGTSTRARRLVAAALLLAVPVGVVAAAPSASAAPTVVQASLVRTIQTSQFSPPSPDPAGITYEASTDRLVIVDSEVDEMTIYQGANIYMASRNGALQETGTTVPWSVEPTDVGIDPADNTLYISDDDRNRVFVARPGTDGRHGTADDLVTSFSTSVFGSTDAEGVEYDPASGHVFIADGTGTEVYDVDPVNGVFGDGNDVVTHFDVAQYGAKNCEGLGSDPQRGTLLVIDDYTRKIYEVTKAGALSRIIDLSGLGTPSPELYAGVTMAPSSDPNDSPSRLNYWIVDRQVDNGPDPNENDGKLYEVSVPSADAPPSVSISSPAVGATVSGTISLAATASDDVGVTQVAFAVDGVAAGTDTNGADGWSVSFDTTTIANGPHTVSATARDTALQTAVDSRGFTVANNTAPSVTITAPANGGSFFVGDAIAFTGAASDAEDGSLTSALSWTSSLDGPIGTGGSFSRTLSEGTHTITASVTDTGGRSASASVTITVAQRPPSATTVTVASISYSTEGGKLRNSHLVVNVALVDNLGRPVAGATVGVRVERSGSLYRTFVGSTGTNGVYTFKVSNAPSGCYASTVTSIVAAGLTWDGQTPTNGFCKQ